MQSIAITALVFLFTLGSFSEIRDYRATTENDRAVTDAILKTFAQTPPTGDVAILGLNPSHLPTQSLLYHEHITGVTESTWALRGMLESRGFDSPHEIVPLPTDRKIIYEPWNHSEKSLARFSTFYRYEQATASLIPLTCQRIGEAEWCLTNPDGSLFAQVREEALIGSLILFPS